MSDAPEVGCTRPSGGVVEAPDAKHQDSPSSPPKEVVKTMIQVGKPAPDFVAPAYLQGKFTKVKLSDYLGKWVVLCFYPGDFTFV